MLDHGRAELRTMRAKRGKKAGTRRWGANGVRCAGRVMAELEGLSRVSHKPRAPQSRARHRYQEGEELDPTFGRNKDLRSARWLYGIGRRRVAGPERGEARRSVV